MEPQALTFFVSPNGDDAWSGRAADPAPAGNDGPFATLARARDAVRTLRAVGAQQQAITVVLRGGRYPLAAPLVFGPEDSGPVTYAAYEGERPIIDGGQRIEGWRIERVNERSCWVVDLPEVVDGIWYFRQLWVNGERRQRARVPKDGFYWMEDVPGTTFSATLFAGTDTFQCAPEDIELWHNLSDVEVVALHYWVEERMPIASFDPVTRMVRSARHSIFALKDDVAKRFARYYVEHVFEELRDPGEWYLDRKSGRLYYVPVPGETPETSEVYAPRSEQLLLVQGDPDTERFVEGLRFVGLTFCHGEWNQPTGRGTLFADSDDWSLTRDAAVEFAASPQAASDIPGTLRLEGARGCVIEACVVEHIGGYAIEFADGCSHNHVIGNELCDLGAGGVKLNGSATAGSRARRTGENRITDNHIHAGGRVFPSAVGVFAAHTFGNTIAHNHIHDLYYTGISCGWVWGYAENVARDNLIAYNHIHHLGHGQLSDMGGIYTLGVQPGTVVRGNLIHDIEKHNYGGWAIYLDEGSSHILVEDNICYNTSSQLFHQHYGRENIIRNNIFAFGREGLVGLGRAEEHNSFTLTGNILVGSGQPLYAGGYAGQVEQRGIRSDLNVLWDVEGRALVSGDMVADAEANWSLARSYGLDEWRDLGLDRHSVVADPQFADLGTYDFTLTADSPACALGFRPLDLSRVGPRSPE
jgi:hypothetical protein